MVRASHLWPTSRELPWTRGTCLNPIACANPKPSPPPHIMPTRTEIRAAIKVFRPCRSLGGPDAAADSATSSECTIINFRDCRPLPSLIGSSRLIREQFFFDCTIRIIIVHQLFPPKQAEKAIFPAFRHPRAEQSMHDTLTAARGLAPPLAGSEGRRGGRWRGDRARRVFRRLDGRAAARRAMGSRLPRGGGGLQHPARPSRRIPRRGRMDRPGHSRARTLVRIAGRPPSLLNCDGPLFLRTSRPS